MTRAQNAFRRRLARWFARRPFEVRPGPAIVSFTFDDFPVSALRHGGRILREFGASGTYYASLGLAGSVGPTGEIFATEDLPTVVEAGHELGCHTYDHCPAWETPTQEFADSVQRNAAALLALMPTVRFKSHSYPINYPRPATKRFLESRFPCCRAGGQRANRGKIDLNYVSAFFIEQSRDNPFAIRALIHAAVDAGDWLVFATHDVSDTPTRYGCTPRLFADIVHWATNSGALILPVGLALETLKSRRSVLARTCLAHDDPRSQLCAADADAADAVATR